MKYCFIINPKAGKNDRHEEFIRQIEQHFGNKNEEYSFFITQHKGHATEIAKTFCQNSDYCRIIGFGGDGTLNEIVNGVYNFENCEIGIYPSGTGNDYTKMLSEKPESITLSQLLNGKAKKVDIIKVNDKAGINVCSVGFDSYIAKNVSLFKKYVGGQTAYLLSLAYSFLTKTKFNLEIRIDNGEKTIGNYIFAVAANGRYYGGGFTPSKNAQIDDGLIDFVLIKAVSRLTILKLIDKYKTGEHLSLTDLVTFIKGKKMQILSKKPFYINIDGEVSKNTAVTFEVLADKIKVIVPFA